MGHAVRVGEPHDTLLALFACGSCQLSIAVVQTARCTASANCRRLPVSRSVVGVAKQRLAAVMGACMRIVGHPHRLPYPFSWICGLPIWWTHYHQQPARASELSSELNACADSVAAVSCMLTSRHTPLALFLVPWCAAHPCIRPQNPLMPTSCVSHSSVWASVCASSISSVVCIQISTWGMLYIQVEALGKRLAFRACATAPVQASWHVCPRCCGAGPTCGIALCACKGADHSLLGSGALFVDSLYLRRSAALPLGNLLVTADVC